MHLMPNPRSQQSRLHPRTKRLPRLLMQQNHLLLRTRWMLMIQRMMTRKNASATMVRRRRNEPSASARRRRKRRRRSDESPNRTRKIAMTVTRRSTSSESHLSSSDLELFLPVFLCSQDGTVGASPGGVFPVVTYLPYSSFYSSAFSFGVLGQKGDLNYTIESIVPIYVTPDP